MGALLDTLKNLGPMRLALIGGAIFGLIIFFIYLTTRLASPQMALLYGELGREDSTQILKALQGQNVGYELAKGGSEIYVPADQVNRLRLTMAEQGIPSGGGSVGYEIFDSQDALGSTNFLQNVNLVRALEGELSRTISSIDTVKSARVHLVMPRRELFSRERQEPSASIILKMRGPVRLGKEQIIAVQHMVAAAVPELTPSKISIVDDKGNLLARGFDGEGGAFAEDAEEKRMAFENRMARTIEELLEKTVGFGKVRAEVSAELDFDRVTTSKEVYDPDGQVVRSTQTVEESARTQDSEGELPVTVENNLPDAGNPEGSSASSFSDENRTEETVNYEISKTVTNLVRETGNVKRLSVAVLVDGTYGDGEDGQRVYTPRPEQQMDMLATLTRTAIGFDADRGDSVEVINMQFADIGEVEEPPLELFFGLNKNDLMRMAEILVLSIVAILVILLVVRPLISRAFEAVPAGMTPEGALLEGGGAPALTGPGGAPVPTDVGPPEEEEAFEELIDIDRVEGRVKASSVKKVGEIVDKHPEEALSIVRNWMYQEG